jgi:hypothetical protein
MVVLDHEALAAVCGDLGPEGLLLFEARDHEKPQLHLVGGITEVAANAVDERAGARAVWPAADEVGLLGADQQALQLVLRRQELVGGRHVLTLFPRRFDALGDDDLVAVGKILRRLLLVVVGHGDGSARVVCVSQQSLAHTTERGHSV